MDSWLFNSKIFGIFAKDAEKDAIFLKDAKLNFHPNVKERVTVTYKRMNCIQECGYSSKINSTKLILQKKWCENDAKKISIRFSMNNLIKFLS